MLHTAFATFVIENQWIRWNQGFTDRARGHAKNRFELRNMEEEEARTKQIQTVLWARRTVHRSFDCRNFMRACETDAETCTHEIVGCSRYTVLLYIDVPTVDCRMRLQEVLMHVERMLLRFTLWSASSHFWICRWEPTNSISIFVYTLRAALRKYCVYRVFGKWIIIFCGPCQILS